MAAKQKILIIVKGIHFLQGKEGGLDPVQLVKLQTTLTFFDPNPSKQTLGFGKNDLEEALRKTVDAGA
jgi:hypothetical protein